MVDEEGGEVSAEDEEVEEVSAEDEEVEEVSVEGEVLDEVDGEVADLGVEEGFEVIFKSFKIYSYISLCDYNLTEKSAKISLLKNTRL